MDTSGSMGAPEMGAGMREVLSVTELCVMPCILGIHDHGVKSYEEVPMGATIEDLLPRIKGGGGTSHREPLERTAQDSPAWCVCLTDAYTDWPANPGFPVIVATPKDHGQIPSWARHVVIED